MKAKNETKPEEVKPEKAKAESGDKLQDVLTARNAEIQRLTAENERLTKEAERLTNRIAMIHGTPREVMKRQFQAAHSALFIIARLRESLRNRAVDWYIGHEAVGHAERCLRELSTMRSTSEEQEADAVVNAVPSRSENIDRMAKLEKDRMAGVN